MRAICYSCVMHVSKSKCALGIRVLATLFYLKFSEFLGRGVTKCSETHNSGFLGYLYGKQFPKYLLSINGVITRILKFKEETTALYRYSGHQLPSKEVQHAKERRPLS